MMDSHRKKINELKAEVIQAMAHPIRLAIVEYLADGQRCVCDIVEHCQAQRSNVSRHLSVMLKAGVLDSQKEGLKVYYRLRTPCITNFLGCVEEVLKERMQSQAELLGEL